MEINKSRPLTKHENLLRLLFEYADEIIDRLGFLNDSALKLERIELMINGVDGAPGLLEVVEALTYEVNRVERRILRSSVLDVSDISMQLLRIESVLDKIINAESIHLENHKNYLAVLRRLNVFIWLGSVLGVLIISLLAWVAMA